MCIVCVDKCVEACALDTCICVYVSPQAFPAMGLAVKPESKVLICDVLHPLLVTVVCVGWYRRCRTHGLRSR